jgi:hypothetical protein
MALTSEAKIYQIISRQPQTTTGCQEPKREITEQRHSCRFVEHKPLPWLWLVARLNDKSVVAPDRQPRLSTQSTKSWGSPRCWDQSS